MSTKVWMSSLGRAVDPEDAKISVFDRGFLYGDSVYETVRTVGGEYVELGAHLERLHRSAAGIALEIPFTNAEIRAAVDAAVAASGPGHRRFRIVVTRGTGPMQLDIRGAESPQLVVYVQDLELPSEDSYARGISAMLVPRHGGGHGVRPGLKTGNYLGHILSLRAAIERSGDDAILLNAEGHVAEGATSNVFMVTDGRVVTPPLDVGALAGITRQRVMSLVAELGVSLEEATVLPEALRAAEEVFLTSSVRGIMPVTRLDGDAIGAGVRGPVTTRLHAAYEAFLERIGRGEGAEG